MSNVPESDFFPFVGLFFIFIEIISVNNIIKFSDVHSS